MLAWVCARSQLLHEHRRTVLYAGVPTDSEVEKEYFLNFAVEQLGSVVVPPPGTGP